MLLSAALAQAVVICRNPPRGAVAAVVAARTMATIAAAAVAGVAAVAVASANVF